MMSIRKMNKSDVETLFDIALRSFQVDYEKYGVYPPLIKIKQNKFLPPLMFGRVILVDDRTIGGAFVLALGSKGELGAIFLDPQEQHKGYGKQAMLLIEHAYPKVRKWKLETPSDSYGLHRFYEELGYIKARERVDKKSGMRGFIYEKTV